MNEEKIQFKISDCPKLKEDIEKMQNSYQQEINKLHQEIEQYKNNWEELKKYLNNGINYWEEQEKEWIEQGFMKFGGEANTKIIYQGILNKMKELEEDK